MFHLVDESIERFLRAEVPLSERDVDLSFDAPDRDWSAKVRRPTLNLFLWDVRLNTAQREAGMALTQDTNGRRVRHAPKPRVDVRYLVTAWTTKLRDEHELLGWVLATLLVHGELPERYLGDYASVRPLPSLTVAESGDPESTDFWSAIGGQLKPGLDLVVTATVDRAVLVDAGETVTRYDLALGDLTDPARTSRVQTVGGLVDDPDLVGVSMYSPRGRAVVDTHQRFAIRADNGDRVTADTPDAASAEVPSQGPVRLGRRAKTGKR